MYITFIFLVFILSLNISLETIKYSKDQESLEQKSNITDGIYNLLIKDKDLSIAYYNNKLILSAEKIGSKILNFRIKQCLDEREGECFFIELIEENKIIGIEETEEKNKIIIGDYDEIILYKKNQNSYEWDFVLNENGFYLIKNEQSGCYLQEINGELICNKDMSSNPTHFRIFKLYEEVMDSYNDLSKLQNEPIDLLIKPSDDELNGLNQTKNEKEEKNYKIRYTLRSILKNIPWIRKIFIIFLDEQIQYLNELSIEKDIIEQINERDFNNLDYDSLKYNNFQFSYWKMKEYGISDNFILMSDNYFIGKPLNKSDFFYVENSKIFPSIISTSFEFLQKEKIFEKYDKLIKDKEKTEKFLLQKYATYYFLISILNEDIIIPIFTDNAIPVNLEDLNTIYDLINNLYQAENNRKENEKKEDRKLESLIKITNGTEFNYLHFEIFLLTYTFNNYNRKVKSLEYNCLSNNESLKDDYNYPLFSIKEVKNNNNSEELEKDYILFLETKIALEKLFPTPTEYEIFNYTLLPNYAHELIYLLEMMDKKNDADSARKIMDKNDKLKKELEALNIEISQFKAENQAIISKNRNIQKDIDKCLEENSQLMKQNEKFKIIDERFRDDNDVINEMNKYKDEEDLDNKDIKQYEEKLDEYKMIENEYIYRINLYKKEEKKDLREIEYLESKNGKIKAIIYFQLAIIIAVTVILVTFMIIKGKNEKCKENKEIINHTRSKYMSL